MTKPTEEELAAFMEAYASAYCAKKGRPSPVIDWEDEAMDLLDYYEATAKPNGDWQMKGGQRIKSWERTAQRSVRRKIKYFLRQGTGSPVPYHSQGDRPLESRTEAQIEESRRRAREEIRKYLPSYGGEA